MASKYESQSGKSGTIERVWRRIRNHRYAGLAFNMTPAAFWLIFFFVIPLAVMLYYSFGERGAFGEVLLGGEHIGLQQYRKFFIAEGVPILEGLWYTLIWTIEYIIPFNLYQSLTGVDPSQYVTPFYQLTIKSIRFGVFATIISFVIGYPMAYFTARMAPDRYQNLLIVLVVLPFWASFLVRIYAIQLLLARNGIVYNLTEALPFVEQGIRLLNTEFSVYFGLVYIWIPFMILPTYASIEQIDFTLHEAAMDLGADRLDAFLKITLPLSMPGVIAGSILVFIPSVGAFVIPDLLGNPNTTMIGQFIADQFGAAGNWPLGAAASFVLTFIMLISIGIYQRYAGGDLV